MSHSTFRVNAPGEQVSTSASTWRGYSQEGALALHSEPLISRLTCAYAVWREASAAPVEGRFAQVLATVDFGVRMRCGADDAHEQNDEGERVDVAMAEQPTVGQRRTRQRAEVERELEDIGDFISAQELHRRLTTRGAEVGLATVYRSLQAMAESGVVDVLRTDSGESVYRRCAEERHHHHLVCRNCGTAVDIARPAVETWAAEVATAHGFTDVTHVVELFGLCARCTALAESGDPPGPATGAESTRG